MENIEEQVENTPPTTAPTPKPKKLKQKINITALNLEAHDVTTDPWTHILNCQNYDGSCEITISSKQMKDCKATWKGEANQFEPRLLAYQTSANSRPDIFKRHGISILPVQNGTYMLTKKKIYQPLDYSQHVDSPQPTYLKRDTSSILLSLGDSETSFIDNLRYCGVFERPEFLNEPITHGSLLNGRHRCSFEMKLEDVSYSVPTQMDSITLTGHYTFIFE